MVAPLASVVSASVGHPVSRLAQLHGDERRDGVYVATDLLRDAGALESTEKIMIRFIDLRGQIDDAEDDAGESLPIDQQRPHFAFYDTITNSFVEVNGSQDWRSKHAFASDFKIEATCADIRRFLSKMPEWVPVE
jgi:hypothetical protein